MSAALLEKEVKVRIRDAEAGRDALRRAGARLLRARYFEDNVLLDDARGSLRASGRLLRVRRTDRGGALTYKGARTILEGVKAREEIETAVSDPEALQRALEAAGLRPIFRYQKFREQWRLGAADVLVDETPIGAFLEIEAELSVIHTTAAALGFSPPDYVSDSYAGLFLASGGSGDMVFK